MTSAAGPSSTVLSSLSGVFLQINQYSLDQCNTANIIPVPKKSKSCSLNDERPIALTSLVMKVLQKLVKSHSMSSTGTLLDPLRRGSMTPNCSCWTPFQVIWRSVDPLSGSYLWIFLLLLTPCSLSPLPRNWSLSSI